MAKQVINNGETGLVTRTKLNDNFTEVYDGKVPYTGATADVNLGVYDVIATSGSFGTNVTAYSGNFDTYILVYRDAAAAAGFLALNTVAGWQFQVTGAGDFEINRYHPSYVIGCVIEGSTGNIIAGGIFKTSAKTVATLPAAISNTSGKTYVTDSTVGMSGNYGAIVAGGGSNKVPVFCDGVDWRIG